MKKLFLGLGIVLFLSGCTQKQTAVTPQTPRPQVEATSPTQIEATPMLSSSLIIPLATLNNSGQTGTVTLEPSDGKTKVTVALVGQPAGSSQPAHFHTGTCAKPGSVVYPLSAVVDGTSVTLVDASIAQMQAKSTVVNVHKSATESGTYIACAQWDLPTSKDEVPIAPGLKQNN